MSKLNIKETCENYKSETYTQLIERHCDNACAICLQNFTIAKPAFKLPCHETHIFHQKCVIKLACQNTQLRCPQCKKNFSLKEIELCQIKTECVKEFFYYTIFERPRMKQLDEYTVRLLHLKHAYTESREEFINYRLCLQDLTAALEEHLKDLKWRKIYNIGLFIVNMTCSVLMVVLPGVGTLAEAVLGFGSRVVINWLALKEMYKTNKIIENKIEACRKAADSPSIRNFITAFQGVLNYNKNLKVGQILNEILGTLAATIFESGLHLIMKNDLIVNSAGIIAGGLIQLGITVTQHKKINKVEDKIEKILKYLKESQTLITQSDKKLEDDLSTGMNRIAEQYENEAEIKKLIFEKELEKIKHEKFKEEAKLKEQEEAEIRQTRNDQVCVLLRQLIDTTDTEIKKSLNEEIEKIIRCPIEVTTPTLQDFQEKEDHIKSQMSEIHEEEIARELREQYSISNVRELDSVCLATQPNTPQLDSDTKLEVYEP